MSNTFVYLCQEEEALSYVAGFTVANDVSARDWQMKRNGKQWLLGKTFDTFCPLGPALVTTAALKGKVENMKKWDRCCIWSLILAIFLVKQMFITWVSAVWWMGPQFRTVTPIKWSFKPRSWLPGFHSKQTHSGFKWFYLENHYAHKGCINLIKNTVKMVILWNIIRI